MLSEEEDGTLEEDDCALEEEVSAVEAGTSGVESEVISFMQPPKADTSRTKANNKQKIFFIRHTLSFLIAYIILFEH